MHGRWPSPRLALPLLAFAALLALTPTASAKKGPCVLGQKKPKCFIQTAKVKAIGDGDTFKATVGGSNKQQLIRMTGIQAMELKVYGRRKGRKGECNAVKAAVALDHMLRHKTVRLVSVKRGAITKGSRGRWRRAVQVKLGGRWVDPALELLRKSLVLWFPNGQEWAWNRQYSQVAAEMAAKGRGIWDPASCGPGPGAGIPLAMKLKWDAEGSDAKDPNQEWARVINLDPTRTLDLHNWWFRDSHLRPRLEFPAGAHIPPLGMIKIHAGRGQHDADSFYWGLREAPWENVIAGPRAMGDGGYLFDPKGNVRAFVQYPCRVNCGEPAAGRVSMQATYRGTEYVTLTNTSSSPLNLSFYEVESVPWFYEFGPFTILQPGQALVLYIQNGGPQGQAQVRNWGHKSGLLADKKDVVTLRNTLGAPVVCHAWGGKKCPKV
jgi:endonuclease YncB( thermonuclease family)